MLCGITAQQWARVKHVHRTNLRPAPQPTSPPDEFNLTEPETGPSRDEVEDQQGEWWITSRPTEETMTQVAPDPPVNPPQPAAPVVTVTPPGDTEATDSMEGTSGTGPTAVRRSQRETAGRHANPHRLPVTVGQRWTMAATSRVPGSGSMHSMFRPWK